MDEDTNGLLNPVRAISVLAKPMTYDNNFAKPLIAGEFDVRIATGETHLMVKN